MKVNIQADPSMAGKMKDRRRVLRKTTSCRLRTGLKLIWVVPVLRPKPSAPSPVRPARESRIEEESGLRRGRLLQLVDVRRHVAKGSGHRVRY